MNAARKQPDSTVGKLVWHKYGDEERTLVGKVIDEVRDEDESGDYISILQQIEYDDGHKDGSKIGYRFGYYAYSNTGRWVWAQRALIATEKERMISKANKRGWPLF